MSTNRRQFLAAMAAAGLAEAKSLPAIGVQLYTLRNVLPEKPLETLRAVEQTGYREAEVTFSGIEKVWPALKQTALKPVSIHLDTALFMKKRDQLPAALDDVRQRGFEYAVCPYIAPQDRGGVDVIEKLADTLNEAGERCRMAGLKLCYHNHAFEFAPAGGGSTLLDVLMKRADPKLVGLEMDIMWVTVGGGNPVSLLEKYSGRVWLMHLKNVAAGVGPQFNEMVPKPAFKEVGKGVIDIPAVLRAASAAKVAHYFVEQDQTMGDPLVSLRESFDYLKGLDF